MEENKMEVIAEQAKEMVNDAVKGLDGKEKMVLGGCALVVAAVSIGLWEGGKRAVPAIKGFFKRTFGSKSVVEAGTASTEAVGQ